MNLTLKGVNLRRTELLDAQPREPLAHIDRRLQRLPSHQAREEPAGKGVAGTVGVVDLGGVDGVHGELPHLGLALDGDEGGLGALGDDDGALALGVLLGEVGEGEGDVAGRVGGEGVRLCVRGGLGLVADDEVGVGDGGVEDVLEELGDEGRGEVEGEDLVLGGGEGAELLDGGGADWEGGVSLGFASSSCPLPLSRASRSSKRRGP